MTRLTDWIRMVLRPRLHRRGARPSPVAATSARSAIFELTNPSRRFTLLRLRTVALLSALLMFQPTALWACAACYGANDSSMAKGMNAGIFSLLGVVVVVLGSVGGFFIYLIKKSAASTQPARETVTAASPVWGQPSPFSVPGAEKTAELNPTSS